MDEHDTYIPNEMIQHNLRTRNDFRKLGINWQIWNNGFNLIKHDFDPSIELDFEQNEIIDLCNKLCITIINAVLNVCKNIDSQNKLEELKKDLPQNTSKDLEIVLNNKTTMADKKESNKRRIALVKYIFTLLKLTCTQTIDFSNYIKFIKKERKCLEFTKIMLQLGNILIKHKIIFEDDIHEITSKIKPTKFKVSLWNRDPSKYIFLGDKVECCIGMTHYNREGMIDYLFDTGIQILDVYRENANNEFNDLIGFCRFFIGQTNQNKKYLVIDGITLIDEYGVDYSHEDSSTPLFKKGNSEIMSKIIQFAEKYAQALRLNGILLGLSTLRRMSSLNWPKQKFTITKIGGSVIGGQRTNIRRSMHLDSFGYHDNSGVWHAWIQEDVNGNITVERDFLVEELPNISDSIEDLYNELIIIPSFKNLTEKLDIMFSHHEIDVLKFRTIKISV
jgi:hypothetical protein